MSELPLRAGERNQVETSSGNHCSSGFASPSRRSCGPAPSSTGSYRSARCPGIAAS
ncbi:hypothetical protein [Streptomyces silvisoli]|uniref:Uncharacterized protein n=1 Tax=Streptomyces silvisoli TaxID=3034235 RepID=A0ABT5ZM19_9ACTN|nr:hypothetical protein [Streptomyces silvisoli]MDF3290635.1 hypothetical protein [Streptomyces silvisoli]